MNLKPVSAVRSHILRRATVLSTVTVLALVSATYALAQSSLPTFSKSFNVDTIGPGSISTLQFDINNDTTNLVENLAFTDSLPAGVTIATPAQALSDCGGTLNAPEGGTTISLTDGFVAPESSCLVFVNVTSITPGTHNNVSGDLTSNAGNSGSASADLVVDSSLPGFTKSFSPASVSLGARSTLTFTVDNSANGSGVSNLDFTDNLPIGMSIADPANAATDCGSSAIPPVLTATAGTSVIVLDADGTSSFLALDAGETCSIAVDVVPSGTGALDNVSGDLLANFVAAGKAGDTLQSTAGDIVLIKEFIADPVPPGNTVDLEFTILNRTRSDTASDIAFTDDLDATLAGLVAVGLPASPCGGSISGASTLSFTGGTVAPASECSFTVTLEVPTGASPGIYPNTTSNVSADFGGAEPVSGNQATDDLFVFAVPTLEKTFIDNPAAAGGSTEMEFTITNTSATFSATDIAFTDELTTFLPSPVSVTLPPTPDPPCGTGSAVSLVPVGIDGEGLELTGGELTPGDSCTFRVSVDLPGGLPGGIYTNTTQEITATVNGTTVTGNPATDNITVVSPPTLNKNFTDDPVQPGDTVTLQFTLQYDELAPGDATDIAFTDDLDAVLSGLTATGLPLNDVCGTGSQISGTSNLSLNGGTLAPGASCTFVVTLQVPAGAPSGNFTNTTSPVTATISGLEATGLPGEDTLTVAAIQFSKEFINDPALPGGQTTLRFTIDNLDATADATDIIFFDDLDATLTGLVATGLPLNDVCGTGSQISGTSNLSLTGGNLPADTSCTFDVILDVPPDAVSSTYPNITSSLSGSLGGTNFSLPPATDALVVDNNLLTLSKTFTDDPVEPGGTANLEFTVTNLDLVNSAVGITFTDDLDAALSGLAALGLPASDVCGAGSQISGTSLLTLTGGTLPAGGSCTFSITVQVPAAVSLGSVATNTTSDVTGTINGFPVQGAPASDVLLVQNIVFTKAFDGPSTATGTPVLTFTLTNLSAVDGATGLAFIDDLDAVIPGLVATGLPASGDCGAGSQISGTSQLTFTNGALAPGESCTISVTLLVPQGVQPGNHFNTTSTLTAGGLPAASPATATLRIEPAPTFVKVFNPNSIAIDGVSTLTFTINNSASALSASSLDFTDNLPTGLAVASPSNASTTCTDGTLSADAGGNVISYSGGTVAAGTSCTVQANVTGSVEDTFVNTSSELTSSSGSSGTSTDSINVISGEFVITKSFRTEPVLPAGLVEMELSIVNGSDFPLADVSVTDNLGVVLTGLVAEGLPQTDVCGTGSQVSGTSTVSLTGANLPAGGSCTVVVPVRVSSSASAGTFTNTTSTATGTREGVGVTADPATADLIVETLGFTKSFNPTLVPVGGTVTATFEIVNPDPANAVSGLTFSDDLEAFVPGMTAVNTPIADACGVGSEVSGTSTITLTNGTIAAGGSCMVQVDLNIPADTIVGDFTNITSALTSGSGSTQTSVAASSAVLGVQPLPTFSKAFSPGVILPRDSSTLTFVIDNSGSQLDADSLAFDDNLPAGMVVASVPAISNNCGGLITANPGTDLIQLTDGIVTAGSVCQIKVDITISRSGTFTNVTEDLTSNLGNSGNANADLRVNQPLPVPLFDDRWLALIILLLAAVGWQATRAQQATSVTTRARKK